jgi:hypothetical protein
MMMKARPSKWGWVPRPAPDADVRLSEHYLSHPTRRAVFSEQLCMSAGHILNDENKIEGGRVSRPAPAVHARLSQPSARHFAR